MPGPIEYKPSPELEQLNQILAKIMVYQHSLPDGRPVELDELQRQGVLSSADLDFLKQRSVSYKPHRLSDYHALDTLEMPTKEGCIFIGPGGPPLKNRSAKLRDFQAVVQNFLTLPRPKDELLLHIQFAPADDGVGVSPGHACFIFKSEQRRNKVPAIRSVARDLGLSSRQDVDIQDAHILAFDLSSDPNQTTAAVAALLSRGCGFSQNEDISYSAGALDQP